MTVTKTQNEWIKNVEVAFDGRLCSCESGLESGWVYDSRGIEVRRVCDACKEERLQSYRRDIFEDDNYPCDEQIEPDE